MITQRNNMLLASIKDHINNNNFIDAQNSFERLTLFGNNFKAIFDFFILSLKRLDYLIHLEEQEETTKLQIY